MDCVSLMIPSREGEMTMDASTIQIVAAVLVVLLIGIIVLRRKRKKSAEEND